MTIDRQENSLIFAVCDKCGERRPLDLAPDATDEEVSEEIGMAGWDRRKPDRHRFTGQGIGKPATVIYPQDFCADCNEATADGPRPRFNETIRPRPHTPRDAFANDPCDEWPRPAIFASCGLRSDCGHPQGPFFRCGHCEAGYAPGRTTGRLWA